MEINQQELRGILEKYRKEATGTNIPKYRKEYQDSAIQAICQLFPQPLTDEALREMVIDGLHWRGYEFIGQSDIHCEGILTQRSEEKIADQFLALLQQKIEEAKEQEREI